MTDQEIDFAGEPDAKARAKAFAEAVNGVGITTEGGRELELWAHIDAARPTVVPIGCHPQDPIAAEDAQAADLVAQQLADVRAHGGASQRPSSAPGSSLTAEGRTAVASALFEGLRARGQPGSAQDCPRSAP